MIHITKYLMIPNEIIEKILLYLPIHQLLIYQETCKTWNNIIKDLIRRHHININKDNALKSLSTDYRLTKYVFGSLSMESKKELQYLFAERDNVSGFKMCFLEYEKCNFNFGKPEYIILDYESSWRVNIDISKKIILGYELTKKIIEHCSVYIMEWVLAQKFIIGESELQFMRLILKLSKYANGKLKTPFTDDENNNLLRTIIETKSVASLNYLIRRGWLLTEDDITKYLSIIKIKIYKRLLIDCICKYENYRLMKFFWHNFKKIKFYYLFTTIIDLNRMNMLKWFDKRIIDFAYYKDHLVHATCHGHIDMIKWFLRKGYSLCKIIYFIMYESISIENLQWALNNGAKWQVRSDFRTYNEFYYAILNNRYDIIQWLEAYGAPDHWIRTKELGNFYHPAIINGNLEMVKWLYEHQYPKTNEACKLAIEHNHLRILEFLLENDFYSGKVTLDNDTVDSQECYINDNLNYYAACAKNLTIMQWLHNHGFFIYPELLKKASSNGDLDMIKWIRKQLPYHQDFLNSCDLKNICIPAFAYYHFHVIQWLDSNHFQWNADHIRICINVASQLFSKFDIKRTTPIIHFLIQKTSLLTQTEIKSICRNNMSDEDVLRHIKFMIAINYYK